MSVKLVYSRPCGVYGKDFWQRDLSLSSGCQVSPLSSLPSFLFCFFAFLLPFPLLALTNYNINLFPPGRNSLGNNTKSLWGKFCDFTTNFSHSQHYFSSWWKAEEWDVIGKKSEEWLGGWRASQMLGYRHEPAHSALLSTAWYMSHFKICNMVQVSKRRSLGWLISCTHIKLAFGREIY